MTHNEDSNQLYSSFMGKKENSGIKAESGETSKRFLYREGKTFLFGSGRRYRTFKAFREVRTLGRLKQMLFCSPPLSARARVVRKDSASINGASALPRPGAHLYSSGLVKNKQRRNYGEP